MFGLARENAVLIVDGKIGKDHQTLKKCRNKKLIKDIYRESDESK